MSRSAIGQFYMRHRVSIHDLVILLAALLVAAYVAFEVDIFSNEGTVSPAEQVVELDEALLLGGMLAVGLFIFSVRRYVDQKRETARRTLAERKARELAFQDPLTGLANRRQFEEALRVAASSPPAAGQQHGVFLLDLNGFKKVNDSYGHGAGDEVLLIVARRLRAAVRPGDLVARLGGDEFVILAQHLLGAEAATTLAMRIVEALADPVATGSIQHRVGSGIGISLYPQDGVSPGELLRKADVALYRAKAEQRSAIRFFEEEMDMLLKERGQMEAALRQAIDGGEIVPRFRPTFDLGTGKVIAFEAVPHWETDKGEVPVERFLSIAEETGLIHALFEHVLRKACEGAANWSAETQLSIDIFPGQLRDAHLGTTILSILGDCGFDPNRLEVEIAESMLVRDLETAKSALAPLRQSGVTMTLDHFGTGYSNLYHIQEFKLDKVKIDRRFTKDLSDDQSVRMMRALAGLGHGLGLVVTADGIDGHAASSLLSSGIGQAQAVTSLVTLDEAAALSKTVPTTAAVNLSHAKAFSNAL